MAKKRKQTRDDESNASSDSDADSGAVAVRVPKFLKGWLGGEAKQYAYDNHVNEFCEINKTSAHDGTQFALRAANEMLRVFGEFGPWGRDSKVLEEEFDEDMLVPYDAPETLEEGGTQKKKSTTRLETAGTEQSGDAEMDVDAGATRGTKRKHPDNTEVESLQAKEARASRRAHIERFRKSYTNWLRYRYKEHGQGDTARGRHKSGKAKKKSSKSNRADDSGDNLATLIVHELLGLGRATIHVAHPFQLWAKDQPQTFRTRWLKKYKAAGKSRQGRAGAEMQYYARKFHKCPPEVQETYVAKNLELKEEARARREEMSEKVNTRLDPERAAELLENIPFILDPLLSSLSNMLHAKVSFCMGVPDPTEGGRLVIRTLDRGLNHDPIPISFGKSPLFARHIDAFKEYLDDAYRPAELKACAIPGTVPKSPKKSARSTDGQIVIVVQNMSIPEGENWARRNANGDEGSSDSEDEIAKRRRRRKDREEREKRLEDEGPPPKRPRGRPRKNVVADEDEESNSTPRTKKSLPVIPAKRGRKKGQATTSTASGSATLADVSTSRGRKKAPAVASHRATLLSLAKVASQKIGAAGDDDDDDEEDLPQPILGRHALRAPSEERERTLSPPPSPLSSPPAPPQPARPRPKPKPHGRILDKIQEEGDRMDVQPTDPFDLDVDDFEAAVPGAAEIDETMDDVEYSAILQPGENTFSRPVEGAAVGAIRKRSAAMTAADVEPSDRVTRSTGNRRRVPPNGDERTQVKASSSRPTRAKPPSTRAVSAAPTPAPFNPFDRSTWTDWFLLCFTQFSSISCDEWLTLLNLWTRVEGLARFQVGNFILGYQSTDDRPAAVTQWVNTRRVKPIPIARRDLKRFAADFWRWWVLVQPEWREAAGLDGPLTEEHRPNPAGRDWGDLRLAKGRNGMTSVIACLHWWGTHHTLSKGPEALGKQWTEAVADVTYVLDGLLTAGWE